MTLKNPYRPGAATAPLYLAGREPQLRKFSKILAAAPEIPANLRLTGLRGVGKSVLLKEMESLARNDEWSVVRVQLEPRHNTEDAMVSLIAALTEAAARRASTIKAVKGAISDAWLAGRGLLNVTVEDVTFSLAGAAQTEAQLAEALFDGVDTAVRAGLNGYALMLDEAQVIRDATDRDGEHPLSMLVAAVNALQERGLPICLVLCGLPTLGANLQKARTYSERMFRADEIGALVGNPGPARDAFIKPLEGTGVDVADELVTRIIDEVEGYPYFIQLWGAELWDAAQEAGLDSFEPRLLDALEPEIYRRLDAEFYAGRVDALTPAEQDLLLLTAQCPYPPLKTADLRAISTKTDGNINVLMGRLADLGVLYRKQKGQYEYTAPKFAEYLDRRISS